MTAAVGGGRVAAVADDAWDGVREGLPQTQRSER